MLYGIFIQAQTANPRQRRKTFNGSCRSVQLIWPQLQFLPKIEINPVKKIKFYFKEIF